MNKKEEQLIDIHVVRGFKKSNMFLPSGICKWCIFDLRKVDEGKPVKLSLPESYGAEMPRQTRSVGMICSCKLCWLAKLFGPAFSKWQAEVRGKERTQVSRLCQKCYMGIKEGMYHVCSASSLEAVRNLSASIPMEIREKLALETLREKTTPKGDTVLPQAEGGKPVTVYLGGKPTSWSQNLRYLVMKCLLWQPQPILLAGKQTVFLLISGQSWADQ